MAPSKIVVALLGTCDTKLQELLYLRSQILRQANTEVTLIDVGRTPIEHEAISVRQQDLFARHGSADSQASLQSLPRGEVIKLVSDLASKYVRDLHTQKKIHGIVAAGGSGGTSLAAAVLRDALPIGLPKLIVSTVASGDTGPLVGETDITMMYSVVDIAGLNQVLRAILSNAGAAIAAAARAYAEREEHPEAETQPSKRVGITMFGVTTPGVDAVRRHLEDKYPGVVEVYVFHATGHGGKAMERLIEEGRLDAVIDFTTTELCDLVTGGCMSAGPHRLEAAAKAGIPYIVSLGATDMTNFGAMGTVPTKYRERKLYEHNPTVTLMRTSADEYRQVAEHICTKLRTHAKDKDRVQVWMPTGGVSIISVPGGPFEDIEADKVLFSEVQRGLEGSGIRVVEDARHINDEGFARDIAEELGSLLGLSARE